MVADITERRRMEEVVLESERQLRALSSKLLLAQEEERRRIARELHDSIGSSLTAIKLALENALDRIDRASTYVNLFVDLIGVTQEALGEMRAIIAALRPSVLDDLGLLATISWFCRRFQSVHPGINIEKDINIEESAIPETLKIVIFRLMQEAFNNISKHSRAEFIKLSLVKNKKVIRFSIYDNGLGFDVGVALSGKGLGLSSMRERVELSGGSFAIESVAGRGTSIRATWPVRINVASCEPTIQP